MSDVIAAAVEALNTKLGENRLDGSAKFITVSYTHLTLPTIYSV